MSLEKDLLYALGSIEIECIAADLADEDLAVADALRRIQAIAADALKPKQPEVAQ